MKLQKSTIFLEKSIKKYFKVRENCLYAGEYRGAAYSIKT